MPLGEVRTVGLTTLYMESGCERGRSERKVEEGMKMKYGTGYGRSRRSHPLAYVKGTRFNRIDAKTNCKSGDD